MKSILAVLIIFYAYSCCCNSRTDLNKRNSNHQVLDQIFNTIVKDAKSEYGKFVAIVDKAIDTTTIIKSDSLKYILLETNIYWNKKLFPLNKFISGDSIQLFLNENPTKYWNLRNDTKTGWIIISIPKFTKDLNFAAVEVSYFDCESFGVSYLLNLEKKNDNYIIVRRKMISIS